MNSIELSELIYPEIANDTDYEAMYPKRNLPEGAKVTRLGPSPTGFIHLGNLYGAFVDERLAHQSNGVFYLRIEDTDDKRFVDSSESSSTKVSLNMVMSVATAITRRATAEKYIDSMPRSCSLKAKHTLVS